MQNGFTGKSSIRSYLMWAWSFYLSRYNIEVTVVDDFLRRHGPTFRRSLFSVYALQKHCWPWCSSTDLLVHSAKKLSYCLYSHTLTQNTVGYVSELISTLKFWPDSLRFCAPLLSAQCMFNPHMNVHLARDHFPVNNNQVLPKPLSSLLIDNRKGGVLKIHNTS